jgi:transcription termination factor Rho
MTGGIDANALQRPKKFFGAARSIEDGGSLTIIGHGADRHRLQDGRGDLRGVQGHRQHASCTSTASSREADLPRDRRRRGPAPASEELLLDPEELRRVWILRKVLNDMGPVEAMELLKERIKKTGSNAEFLLSLNLT